MIRQIVLDTETTGLEPEQGHRVIEIGAVEVVGRRFTRRHFHCYVDPERSIDDAAMEVHGLTSEFLSDKPKFRDIANEFLDFVRGAELVIHNAPFDVSFLNYELSLLGDTDTRIERLCAVTDSLAIARDKHPGQKNSLDALCRRYGVDNSERELHGALLDAEILADVYLAMTGGQTSLFSTEQADSAQNGAQQVYRLPLDRPVLRVVLARGDELEAHSRAIELLDRQVEGGSVWSRAAGGV